MGATWRKRGKRSWLVTVHFKGEREYKTVHSDQDARQLVQQIHKQELAGVNVVEAIRTARAQVAPLPAIWPRLRDDLPRFIDHMVAVGEWTGSTPETYRRALRTDVLDFVLADGRALGDLSVDQITEAMLGEVLEAVRRKRGSLARQEQIRSPLRRYYRDLKKKRGFTGPNPADDLKDFMSRPLSKRARQRASYPCFTQQEGPVLFTTCAALFPRWLGFVGCGVLAGLRWGEIAALQWEDIDFEMREINVQRSLCDDTREVKGTKDAEDRHVPLSAQLAAWLQEHRANLDLEASVKGWSPEQRAWCFLRPNGDLPRYPSFLEHVWQPLLKKAGLRYRKFHSTRHTFISWNLNGNEAQGIEATPILAVRDWAGHSSVAETERYLHRDRRSHARLVDNLDRYVR